MFVLKCSAFGHRFDADWSSRSEFFVYIQCPSHLLFKMLGRKQSLRGELVLADYGADEFSFAERSDILFINQHWVRIVLRSCALLSLVSICLNTPDTYKKWPPLIYVTFAIDFVVTLVFTAEMLAKMRAKGIYQGEQSYFRDRWCQFDAVMWIFLVISVILHVSDTRA